MPTYEFDTGEKVLQIDAPSREAALAALSRVTPTMRKAPISERVVGGFQQSLVDTAAGIEQLTGADVIPDVLMKPEQVQSVVEAPFPSDWPGIVGYIVGEMAQMGVPASTAIKIGSRLGRLGGLAGDVAVNVGHGALKATSEDESRAMNALEAGLGVGLGRAIGTAAGGVARTGSAQQLMEEATQAGQPLRITPGQAAGKASIPGMLEEASTAIPFGGTMIRAGRRKGLEDWNRLALSKVSPTGTPPKSAGTAGIREVSEQFKSEYGRLLPNDLELRPDQVLIDSLINIDTAALRALDDTAGQRVHRRIETLFDMSADGRLSGKSLKDQVSKLREDSTRAPFSNERDAYEALADSLNDLAKRSISPDDAAALAYVDSQYAKFAPVQEAAGRQGAITEGLFTPAQLLSAVGSGSKAAKIGRARGRMPMQEFATLGEDVLGSSIPPVGPGSAEKVMVGLGAIEPNILLGGAGLAAAYPALNPIFREGLLGNLGTTAQQSGLTGQLGQIPFGL